MVLPGCGTQSPQVGFSGRSKVKPAMECSGPGDIAEQSADVLPSAFGSSFRVGPG